MRYFTIGVSVISFVMVLMTGVFFVAAPSAAVARHATQANPAEFACIWLDTAMSCDQKSSPAH